MKLEQAEIEIYSWLTRINNNELILQPDFQRGQVWSKQKKQKLIDTILRGWKIPPIHIIERKDYIEEVLDGQQRLVAIYEFSTNKFAIDGDIAPANLDMKNLHNFRFCDLEDSIKRRFERYKITKISISEYSNEEPAELFFRLNQPVTLTGAEQRNAFISPARNQVKEIVNSFINQCTNNYLGDKTDDVLTKLIGFSNSRMAYDEIFSKFCFMLEKNTLLKKLSTNEMTGKYRSDEPFSDKIVSRLNKVIKIIIDSLNYKNEFYKLSLNKATFFSWLLFLNRNTNCSSFKYILYSFELYRKLHKNKIQNYVTVDQELKSFEAIRFKLPFFESMLAVFAEKASLASTDSISIIYRDIILQIYYESQNDECSSLVQMANSLYSEDKNIVYMLDSIKNKLNWGAVINETK